MIVGLKELYNWTEIRNYSGSNYSGKMRGMWEAKSCNTLKRSLNMTSSILKLKARLQSEKSLLFLFKTRTVILKVWDCKMLKNATEVTEIMMVFFQTLNHTTKKQKAIKILLILWLFEKGKIWRTLELNPLPPWCQIAGEGRHFLILPVFSYTYLGFSSPPGE